MRGDLPKATQAEQPLASSRMLRKQAAVAAEPLAAAAPRCFCDVSHVSVGAAADRRNCPQHMAKVSVGIIRHEKGAGAERSALR